MYILYNGYCIYQQLSDRRLKDETRLDNVGSVNIKFRASDEEISSVCEKNKYNKEMRYAGIRTVFAARHTAWREIHPNEILTEKEDIEKVVSAA